MEKGGQEEVKYIKVPDVSKLVEKKGASFVFYKARNAARRYIEKLKQKGEISYSEPSPGDVPSIHVVRRTLPEVWETVNMALMGVGQTVHSQDYDPKDENEEYLSFPSMEATVTMHIKEPFGEPRFHQQYLAGWMSLGDYKAEIEGVKDHWMISPETVVDMMKKKRFNEIENDTRWKYTYHQRLYSYPFIDIEGNTRTVNQLESLINKLVREPLSRSAQAITWDPRCDHNDGAFGVKWKEYDSPCLQRFWFKLVPFKDGYKMGANTHWRSRDHLKAVPQNIYAVTEVIVNKTRLSLQEKMGVPIYMGRYVDINDSLHLYGHYYDQRRQGKDAESALQTVFNICGGRKISIDEIKAEDHEFTPDYIREKLKEDDNCTRFIKLRNSTYKAIREDMVDIKSRLIYPGTPMYEAALEDINREYEFRVNNPDAGRG